MRRRLSLALLIGALGALGAGVAAMSASSSPERARASARSIDLTNLPLGDGRVTTSGPRRGYVYACSTPRGMSPGSGQTWIRGSRWDLTAKALVDGSVDWPG